jgi:hypothetical protein
LFSFSVYPVKQAPNPITAKDRHCGEDCADEKVLGESYRETEKGKDYKLRKERDCIAKRSPYANFDQGLFLGLHSLAREDA